MPLIFKSGGISYDSMFLKQILKKQLSEKHDNEARTITSFSHLSVESSVPSVDLSRGSDTGRVRSLDSFACRVGKCLLNCGR